MQVIPLVRQASRALNSLQIFIRWVFTSLLPCFLLGEVSRTVFPPWLVYSIHISFLRALTVVFTFHDVANKAMLLQVSPVSDLVLGQSLLHWVIYNPFLSYSIWKRKESPYSWGPPSLVFRMVSDFYCPSPTNTDLGQEGGLSPLSEVRNLD